MMETKLIKRVKKELRNAGVNTSEEEIESLFGDDKPIQNLLQGMTDTVDDIDRTLRSSMAIELQIIANHMRRIREEAREERRERGE